MNRDQALTAAFINRLALGTMFLSHGFKIASIDITNPGINYTNWSAPTLSIAGGDPTTSAVLPTLTIATNVSGSLTKLGSGTLTLSDDNTYTGPTLVSAGKLVVPSTHAASGGVTVSANASLAVAVSGTSQWQPASLTLANPCTLEFNNLQNPGTSTAPLLPTAAVGPVTNVTININSIPGAVPGNSYPLLGNHGGTTNGYTLGMQLPGVTGSLAVNGTTLVYNVPNGWLNPTPNQNVPMDETGPLALSWSQVSGSTAYDVFLGTVSNSVAAATRNNPLGTYQGDISHHYSIGTPNLNTSNGLTITLD